MYTGILDKATENKCRQVLADHCKKHPADVEQHWCGSFTSQEWALLRDPTKWETPYEIDDQFLSVEDNYDECMEAYMFECDGFDQQIRGYVQLDDDLNVVDYLIRGE